MKRNDAKRRVERGVAESFLVAHNSVNRSAYVIEAEGEAPDFVCRDARTGYTFGLEIAGAYYSDETAKGLWDMIRGRSVRASGAAANPEPTLADRLNWLLQVKWNKDYGARCVLGLHADAELTTAADFQARVLPLLEMPAEKGPFEGIYVLLAGEWLEPEMVWWQLYPRKQRFYEQMRGSGAQPQGRAGRAPLQRGGAARRGQRRRNAGTGPSSNGRGMARQHNT